MGIQHHRHRVKSGGDHSHGDSWPSLQTSRPSRCTSPASAISAGAISGTTIPRSSRTIRRSAAATPHSTLAFSPVTGIGVTVEDIVCDGASDDALCTELGAGFGQISKVNVNDDEDTNGITSTTLLHFYIQLDSSEIPQGTNANTVSVLHAYPGGFETIVRRCTFDRKATVPNNASCITVKNLPGGDLGVDVWTLHNGGLRLQ